MTDLQDRSAISELIERYSDCLNRRDFVAMASLFVPGATWRADPPLNLTLGGETIANDIAAMVDPFAFLLQMTFGVVIDLGDGRAKARTVIHEIGAARNGASGLDAYGLYHDTVVRTDERWRFATRRYQPVYLNTLPLPGYVIQDVDNQA